MSSSPPGAQHWIAEYDALVHRAGLVELERTQIELSGADRSTFMHNLCTADVKRLPAGAGREAFLTSVQGKTLGHVFLFAGSETLVIDTVAGQAESILKHLDHYLITEQVTLTDRSDDWSEWLLAGPRAESLLAERFDVRIEEPRLSHATIDLAGMGVSVRRVDVTQPGGFLISVPREARDALRDALLAAGATRCGHEAFEAARLEVGFPWFGLDITDANLPQEVGRDQQAISFVKGCYLGQETVARIDALGHVNKTLVGLRFDGTDVPAARTELQAGGAVVGHVTSASYSPRLQAPLALGYVRRGHNQVGARLESPAGDAEVIALPLG
jgi:folate-binding protein YgfZ